ncbi:MAG: formate dehydrogenase [Pseudomonadota bacterium]
MADTSKDRRSDRRSFLKLAGASVVGTGAAAAAAVTGAQAAEAPAKPTADGDYHESAHVKRYYDLAREF